MATKHNDALISRIVAKTAYDLDSEQGRTLVAKLQGLDDATLELFEAGLQTRRTASVGPKLEAWLAQTFEQNPWTTVVAAAEGIGHSVPATRGAFATLVKDAKVAIFKDVRRDGRRLVFPGGTSHAAATKLNASEAALRPVWRDLLAYVRETEVDGLPSTAGAAEVLGLTVAKVASTVGVLTQNGWLVSTGLKVGGKAVLTTPDAPKDIASRAFEANSALAAAKKAK